MWKRKYDPAGQAQNDALVQAHQGGGGGRYATVISAFALLFSGYSFYESVLKSSQLEIFVPPRIEYTDPDRPESPFEVFVLPITLTNDGARTGTVLSIDLEVTNPRTKQTKKFYSARIGPWGQEPIKAFAPVSLTGREASSQAVQFFPRADEKIARILDFEAGDYRLKLLLNTTQNDGALGKLFGGVKPLEFEMQIGKLDYRFFTGSNTVPMWSKNYKPVATTSTGP